MVSHPGRGDPLTTEQQEWSTIGTVSDDLWTGSRKVWRVPLHDKDFRTEVKGQSLFVRFILDLMIPHTYLKPDN